MKLTSVFLKARFQLIAIILVFVSAPTWSDSSEHTFSYKDVHSHILKSDATGHEYELLVSLPASYEAQSETRYSVLYLLDAYWDYPLIKTLYDKLRFDQHIPELILVGISYTGSPEHYAQKRAMDFTPVHDEAFKSGGNAKHFLNFLKAEALPLIDSTYRSMPEDRAIAGSSLGGQFSFYTMYSSPGLFKRYLASTPAANWGERNLARMDAQFAKAPAKQNNARLFAMYSAGEYAPYHRDAEHFAQLFSTRQYPGLKSKVVKVDDYRHSGIGVPAYLDGLLWLYEDSRPSGPSGFETMFRELGL